MMYEVVSPTGQPTNAPTSDVSSTGLDLTGKKIGLVLIPFPNGDILLETLAGLLKQKFSGLETVKVPSGKNMSWGEYPDASLTQVVKERGIDAAIVAVGC
jgi:hypothetical protein